MITDQSTGIDILTGNLLCLFNAMMEITIKRIDHILPNLSTGCDIIKFLLNSCSKTKVDDIWEMLHKEVIYHHGNIGREEFLLFSSSDFGFHFITEFAGGNTHFHIISWRSISGFLDDIFSFLDRRNRWSIS